MIKNFFNRTAVTIRKQSEENVLVYIVKVKYRMSCIKPTEKKSVNVAGYRYIVIN